MADDKSPAVRGRYLKELLAFAHGFEPQQPWSAFISAVDHTRVDESATTDWLPIEIMYDIARRSQLSMGPLRYADFNRQLFLRQLQTPLLRPLLFAARAVFNVGLAGMLKHLPRGWSQAYRCMGQARYEPSSESKSIVTIADLPSSCFSEVPWLDGTRHAFGGFFVLVGVDGKVTLEPNASARHIKLTFTT